MLLALAKQGSLCYLATRPEVEGFRDLCCKIYLGVSKPRNKTRQKSTISFMSFYYCCDVWGSLELVSLAQPAPDTVCFAGKIQPMVYDPSHIQSGYIYCSVSQIRPAPPFATLALVKSAGGAYTWNVDTGFFRCHSTKETLNLTV